MQWYSFIVLLIFRFILSFRLSCADKIVISVSEGVVKRGIYFKVCKEKFEN